MDLTLLIELAVEYLRLVKSRGQELSSKLNPLFNHEMSSLFRRRQHFQASKLSVRTLSILFLKKNY